MNRHQIIGNKWISLVRGFRRCELAPDAGWTMLTKAMFDQCLGSKFQLHASPDLKVEAELLEVNAPNPGLRPAGLAREPFSLIFQTPANVRVSQGTYRLEHETMGTLEIFLVPIARDARGLWLEAVFN